MSNFSGQNPTFSNANVNAPGSQYAANYGFQSNTLTFDTVRKLIFDTTPQEYPELYLLNLGGMKPLDDDQTLYYEKQIFRQGVITPVLTANILTGTAQVVPVTNTSAVSKDTIIYHPTTEQNVIVRDVDTSAGTITIGSYTNETLPQLNSGTSYAFGNGATITADGASTIVQSQRLDNLVRRYNYVQLFNRSTSFGVVEMGKYKKLGTTNYVEMNLETLIQEYKYDLANTFWMGKAGNVTLSNGTPAKSMGGIAQTMYAAGSFQVSATPANLLDAVRQACLNTLYSKKGNTKYLLIHPKWIDAIQTQYKQPLVRFAPMDGKNLDLELAMIDFGHTKVVLVGMQRFEARSGSFPPSWEKKGFLLDYTSLNPRYCSFFPEHMDTIASRVNGNKSTLNLFDITYMQGSLTLEYDNPMGGAIINVLA